MSINKTIYDNSPIKNESFSDWIKRVNIEKNKDPETWCPPSLNPQDGINFLAKYLLRENYYIVDPVSGGQANTIIIDEILRKYSKQYRKEVK